MRSHQAPATDLNLADIKNTAVDFGPYGAPQPASGAAQNGTEPNALAVLTASTSHIMTSLSLFKPPVLHHLSIVYGCLYGKWGNMAEVVPRPCKFEPVHHTL